MIGRLAPGHLYAAALCAGLAFANVVRLHGLGAAAASLAAVAVVMVGPPPARLVLAALVLAVVGWWWASTRLDTLDRSALTALVGRAGRATIVVTSEPRPGMYDIRAQGRLRALDARRYDEAVELELPLGRSPPQGAVIAGIALVGAPKGPSNGFDERTWLRHQGIHVVLRVEQWRVVGHRGGFSGLADSFRRRLARAIAPRLGGERRAVLEGIVLGDDTALSDGLRRDFRASGLYHILAVSGQNVVLVAGGVLGLAWLLGVSRIAGELGALAAIGAYVVAVGPQPSVIRAGVAGALASVAWLSGRMRDAWQALLLGAIALLAWNPYFVFDAGFQLSFAAVVAIFLVAPRIDARLEGSPLPRKLRLGVSISLACSAITAPILWLQFGYLPIVGVLANALAEPALPVLLGLAFGTAALDAISPQAASLLAYVDGWVAEYVVLCAHVVGSLPFAQVSTPGGLTTFCGALFLAAYAWRRCRTS